MNGAGLPDVNVLVAAAWPNHVAHGVARSSFEEADRWASTPFTEAGFVRVSSNRAALATSTSPGLALTMLRRLCGLPGHEFWADQVQGVTTEELRARLRRHRQVTDAHLLTVTTAHAGRVVTFDRGLAALAGAPREQVRLLVAG